MQKKLLTVLLVLSIFGVIAGGVWYVNQQAATNQSASQKKVRLELALKNGRPIEPAKIYVVKQGTTVEFSITSDVFGKIGAPVDPPQTITFTQSPLVFHFPASKVGTYPISYQADGSPEVIQIGSVTVRAAE